MEQGVWKDDTRNVPVAVKFLKEEASEINKVKFLQEAAIMAQFKHPNVVSLYGVVNKDKSVCNLHVLCKALLELTNLSVTTKSSIHLLPFDSADVDS